MSLFNIFKKKKKDAKKDEMQNKAIATPEAVKTASPAQKPEAAPDVKKQAAPAAKAQEKPQTKVAEVAPAAQPVKAPTSDTKAVKKPAQKAEGKPEAKTEAKAEPKTTKAEAKPSPKAEAKSTVKATPKAETKAAPTAAPKTEPKPEAPIEDVAAPADSKGYTGRFEINKSKDGKKYFFNLYASNKVGIATSQMYSSAQSALTGIKSVIANAADAPIEDQSLKKYDTLPYPKWEIYIDNGGKYRFRLNASNGSCVCHSQGYTTKTACKNGIDSIIRSSRNAEIDKTYLTTK